MRLVVPGPVTGKARPRMTRRGHVYTPDPTIEAENRIRAAWAAAGRPRLPDGPTSLTITAQVARPRSHHLVDGRLSAAGRRQVRPTSRPDLDNVAKLVGDALNGLAWRDDAQISRLCATREWGTEPRLIIAAHPDHPSTGDVQ